MCPSRSIVYVSDKDMDMCVLLGPLFMSVTRGWTCVSFQAYCFYKRSGEEQITNYFVGFPI